MLVNQNNKGFVNSVEVNASLIALKKKINSLERKINSLTGGGSSDVPPPIDPHSIINDDEVSTDSVFSSAKTMEEIEKSGGSVGWGEVVNNWINGHTNEGTAITADKNGVLVCIGNTPSSYILNIVDCTETPTSIATAYGSYHHTLTVPIIKGRKYYWTYSYSSPSFNSWFYPFAD